MFPRLNLIALDLTITKYIASPARKRDLVTMKIKGTT